MQDKEKGRRRRGVKRDKKDGKGERGARKQ